MTDDVIVLLMALVTLASKLVDFLRVQWEATHKTVKAVVGKLLK